MPKHEYWQRHMARQDESGLTQRAYCERVRLKLPTFRYWK
ncbi:IS66 family insertion sequence element accessory protein TnpA [Sulfidibacter corallicola]